MSSLWDHLPLEELRNMAGFSDHRNVLDVQRLAAIKTIDRQITEDHANGYGADVDALLERRSRLMELLRTGPHS